MDLCKQKKMSFTAVLNTVTDDYIQQDRGGTVSDNEDSGENLILDSSSMQRLPCTVHTLQQMPAVEKIIKNAAGVVGFFHRSLHWSCELKKSACVGPLAACPTSWNSSLIMLRRLVKENMLRTVTELLTKAKNIKGTRLVPGLTATRSQVEDLVSLLDILEEATNSLYRLME